MERALREAAVGPGHDVFPAENARKLQEAFPGSTQLWLPLGHYTAMLHLLWIPSYVTRRLAEMLAPADPGSRR